MNNFLNEASKDLFNELNIPDEAKAKIEAEIAEAGKQLGLEENSVSLVNFGNRSTPSLYIQTEGIDLGSIDVTKDGAVFSYLNSIDVREQVEVTKDVKENLENFMGKDAVQAALELAKTPTQLKTPVQEISGKDIAKEAFDKINASLADKGVHSRMSDKMQKKAMKGIAKDDSTQNRQNRAEIKAELHEVKNTINKLYQDLQYEVAIAKANGYSPERANRIDALGEEIADKTIKAATLEAALPSIKEQVLDVLKGKAGEVTEKVSHGFDKVKTGMEMKVNSGINALSNIKGEVNMANSRFASMRDTAYTHLEENVHNIHRNWMSLNYAIDKTIASEMDKIQGRMEKSFDRQSNIKGAISDLGRAIMGKERTGEKKAYTPLQTKALDLVKGLGSSMRDNMDSLKERYTVSKGLSEHNIRSAQELRQDTGLRPSTSLEQDMQRAREKCIELKKNGPEKPVKENEREMDSGERVR